jgi:PTH1 family peptidyl-tRNA hydrolase
MGLFDRKKTDYFDAQPYYTIGGSKTMVFIGLGNPGKEYSANRHNIGFMALDRYHASHDFSDWTLKKDLQAIISTGQIGATRIILVKPNTFMNASGEAALKIQKFYRIYNSETIVVHDELDIDFGTIRTKVGGGSAGHNGIKSVSYLLGEDYGRIRIGIGPKKPVQIDTADFVLQDFTKEEQELIPKILQETCSLLDEASTGKLPEHTIAIQ